MSELNIELLRRLCETPGIPGREDQIRSVVVEGLQSVADKVTVDPLGNVVGRRNGSGGPKVMIAAHMDEIGFFVSHIGDKGFLRLQPVGGFDPRMLIAQRVLVHGYAGETLRGARCRLLPSRFTSLTLRISRLPRSRNCSSTWDYPLKRLTKESKLGTW